MSRRVRQSFTAVVIAIVCAMCAAVPPVCRGQAPAQVPAEQLLRGPDRRDFPWHVRLLGPRLTYQQRYLVQVRASVPVEAAPGGVRHRDLHFVVKVADEQGRWGPGDNHDHASVPSDLDRSNELQFTSGLYLRPGSYVIAVLAYDSGMERGNVWRKRLRIPRPKHDPLPQLDRDLPPVEFISEVPRDSVPDHVWPISDETWPLGEGQEWLPVRNPRPLRVDIVLNLSNWLDPLMRGAPSALLYRQRVGRLLQVGSVLSHLRLEGGCVRISGVDIHQLRVIFDQMDAANFDWDKAREAVSDIGQNTISVSALEERTSTALFFRRFLSDLIHDSSGCGSSADALHRVVIIAGGAHLFPDGTKLFGVWPEAPCDCDFYYLRTDAAFFDDVESMLKRALRRRFQVTTAGEFRKALAELISDLEKPSKSPTVGQR